MRLAVTIVLFLAASPRLGSTAELAVYLDGALQPKASEALAREADFREGMLTGWRLFGALLPQGARENVGVIEVRGSHGATLRVEDPAHAYAGLEPVLFRDTDGGLRFRMMVAPPGSASRGGQADTPTARQRGQGRVAPSAPANRRGQADTRPARLGIEDVVEIHVAHGPAPGAAVKTEPAAFDLVIGAKTERISAAVLEGLVAAEVPPGAQGEAWPLGKLLEKKNARRVRAVTAHGRNDATARIEAADLGTAYLRINRRGLFKLERPDSAGKRAVNVPDVRKIDVELD